MMFAHALALGAGGRVPATLRLEPASANIFYLVQRTDGAAKVTRFQRGFGGSGGTDAGVAWPEFRPSGLGLLASFDLAVSGNVVWLEDDPGALDIVARNPSLVFFGSYHGVGSAGSLGGETILIDGVSASHTVARSGRSFELRNQITASNGTQSFYRDLSYHAAAGSIRMVLNDVSSSGMDLLYFGMPIASGSGYSESHARWDLSKSFDVLPLGSSDCWAYIGGAKGVRQRDPTTGYFTGFYSSDLPSRSGYVEARTEKQTSTTRTKTYASQFSSAPGLVGAEGILEWGSTTAGDASPAANMLPNTAWDVPPWTRVATGGTATASGGDLTMAWTSGAPSNLRMHHEIPGSQVGKRYALSLDFVSQTGSGTREIYAGSNSNGSSQSPAPAVIKPPSGFGRMIMTFVSTVAYPEQRFGVRNSSSAALTTVWRNPAVLPVDA